jgi:hypothetical protein
MSELLQERIAEPSAPTTDQLTEWYETTTRRKTTKNEFSRKETLSPYGWRDQNLVINGEFDFAQRQAPATLTAITQSTTVRAFNADRWGVTLETAGGQYQRVDTNTAPEAGYLARYYGKYKKITGAGKMFIVQTIEAGSCLHLRGRTCIIQVKMKYSVASALNMRIGLIQLNSSGTVDTMPAAFTSGTFNGTGTDPALGTNLAYIAPRATPTGDGATINGNGGDCVLTTNWQRFSVCVDLPSNFKNLAIAIWSNAQMAINDELNIGEVGLYEGMEIRDWFPSVQSLQLHRAQRFCSKTFETDVAPAQNVGVGVTGYLRCILGKAAATALAAQFQWRFPVTMFKAPTVTLYNPAAANAQVRQIGGTAADLTATATANINMNSVDITATGAAGGTVGDQCGIHGLAESEL